MVLGTQPLSQAAANPEHSLLQALAFSNDGITRFVLSPPRARRLPISWLLPSEVKLLDNRRPNLRWLDLQFILSRASDSAMVGNEIDNAAYTMSEDMSGNQVLKRFLQLFAFETEIFHGALCCIHLFQSSASYCPFDSHQLYADM